MGPRKPNRNHLLLLVTELGDEQERTCAAMQAAGYEEDQLVAENATRAMDYLYARGGFEESRPPSLIIIDLNHTNEEGRHRLAALLENVKSHRSFRLIPVLLILREEDPEDISSWYCMGVHACLFRPDDMPGMTSMFESIRDYWSKRVILPELD